MAANPYNLLRIAGRRNLRGNETTSSLVAVVLDSLDFLSGCKSTELRSNVEEKEYFAFVRERKLSRPIRRDLFDIQLTLRNVESFVDGRYESLPKESLSKLLYTMAISYCCATDIRKKDDKKTPATYFEILVGNIFARKFGLNPKNQIDVLNLDMKSSLPTDFIFEAGNERIAIHLPVKLSTRERVVQVWAHQRVLDGIYGVNRFRGILTVFGETKLGRKNLDVIEICLPDQWRLYQMFIARLHRIYYFDIPHRYEQLAGEFPHIQVKDFSEFFLESESILSPTQD